MLAGLYRFLADFAFLNSPQEYYPLIRAVGPLTPTSHLYHFAALRILRQSRHFELRARVGSQEFL